MQAYETISTVSAMIVCFGLAGIFALLIRSMPYSLEYVEAMATAEAVDTSFLRNKGHRAPSKEARKASAAKLRLSMSHDPANVAMQLGYAGVPQMMKAVNKYGWKGL